MDKFKLSVKNLDLSEGTVAEILRKYEFIGKINAGFSSDVYRFKKGTLDFVIKIMKLSTEEVLHKESTRNVNKLIDHKIPYFNAWQEYFVLKFVTDLVLNNKIPNFALTYGYTIGSKCYTQVKKITDVDEKTIAYMKSRNRSDKCILIFSEYIGPPLPSWFKEKRTESEWYSFLLQIASALYILYINEIYYFDDNFYNILCRKKNVKYKYVIDGEEYFAEGDTEFVLIDFGSCVSTKYELSKSELREINTMPERRIVDILGLYSNGMIRKANMLLLDSDLVNTVEKFYITDKYKNLYKDVYKKHAKGIYIDDTLGLVPKPMDIIAMDVKMYHNIQNDIASLIIYNDDIYYDIVKDPIFKDMPNSIDAVLKQASKERWDDKKFFTIFKDLPHSGKYKEFVLSVE